MHPTRIFVLPYFTFVIIMLNVLIFVAQIVTRDKICCSWEFSIATSGNLSFLGAKVNSKISEGQVWRLVTYAFLHLDIWHLLYICITIFCHGACVEMTSGSRRFFAICFTSVISFSLTGYYLGKSDCIGGDSIAHGLLGANCITCSRDRTIPGIGHKQILLVYMSIVSMLISEISVTVTEEQRYIAAFLPGLVASWFLGPNYVLQPRRHAEDNEQCYVDKVPMQYLIKAWKGGRSED